MSKIEKIGIRALPTSTSELPILYGKLNKSRSQLLRNTKRLLNIKDTNSLLGQSLSRYFLEHDRIEQRLVELGENLEMTLRDSPELLELIIVRFGQEKTLENESIQSS